MLLDNQKFIWSDLLAEHLPFSFPLFSYTASTHCAQKHSAINVTSDFEINFRSFKSDMFNKPFNL